MKYIFLTLLLLIALTASACFGPKLYFGAPIGEDGELLFYLVTIYVKEKTGVESIRVEMTDGQTGTDLLQQDKVDLVFSPAASDQWASLLTVGDELFLLSSSRPTDDLQFTTVPKALNRLQTLLKPTDLVRLRQQVAAGLLPAKAVRQLYMQNGWI